MTLEERSDLVLAFAQALYGNGQATDQTVAAAERLGQALGLRAKIMPRWGELHIACEDRDGRLIAQAPADPTGVNMDRMASTMRAIEDVVAGRLRPGFSRSRPAPWRCRCSSVSSIRFPQR